ncbi:hypothetical protein EI94DRAFT_1807153 [Lactarius quietus]|nr:hypothetical protein EI94DRAFT_1807153 [Lactarius quietus]
MLEFALKFRDALDTITGNKDMKLRKYEMDNKEWEIANQLREVLKTSLSDVYQIAIVLHPHHKLKYFKNTGWSKKQCKAAYVTVHDTFEMYYKNKQHPIELALPNKQQANMSSKNMFNELPDLAAPGPSDLHNKLECYLSSDPEHVMCNDWDATSVNVKRIFSKGQILLSHLCSRLSVQSTGALMCAAAALPEVDGKEIDLEEDWDLICITNT